MREAAVQILHRSGLAAVARRLMTRHGRFVIELHGIPPAHCLALPKPIRPDFVRDDLRRILDWLSSRFEFLTAEEFLAAETPGVLLTFDDGFSNQAREALPVLDEFQAPAVFFVTTQHVVEPVDWLPFVRKKLEAHMADAVKDDLLHAQFDGMSRAQLAECAASPWITIGGHTVSHPFLTRCDGPALRRELEDSKKLLEETAGVAVDLFAYPSGDYDARVAAAVQSAGYRAAFVEETRGLGLAEFEIPRIGLYRADAAYLGAKLSGLHRRPLPLGPAVAQRSKAPR